MTLAELAALRAERDHYVHEANRLGLELKRLQCSRRNEELERPPVSDARVFDVLNQIDDITPNDVHPLLVEPHAAFATLISEREAVTGLKAERNQLAYECSLLAEAWTLVSPIVAGWSPRPRRLEPINALAERHYRKGELEPSGDTVPHPYRMTPELAAALSGLCEAEDPDPEHQAYYHASTLPETYLALSKAVERVTNALRDQQPEIG